jgi:glycosyltransferase involved in cell wall biosynthesis
MARGVPTVATAVGGIPEAIEDGVTGFLVPPANVEALADRLKRVLSDRELRDALGEGARKRFEERFGLGIVTQHQAKVISELIRRTAN